jgi:hypothetical protein
MDGTAIEYTAELQGLMGQFHQSIESQLGQGTVDAMLQYAGTLDAGTQSTLERMVMSGDPAQMQRAVQYLQERMAAGTATGYVPSQGNSYGQPTAQPVGMSHAEFIAAYDQLSQWAQQSGYGPAIASTMNNTALWLRSAPLANVLVANAIACVPA